MTINIKNRLNELESALTPRAVVLCIQGRPLPEIPKGAFVLNVTFHKPPVVPMTELEAR